MKTSKECRAEQLRGEARFQAGMDAAAKEPGPDTWSANMPAYTYTALCPDQELREYPETDDPEANKLVPGIRPIRMDKLCLICRKVWPGYMRRKYCDCERQGYLYEMGTYYQRKTGGDSSGQGGADTILRDDRRDQGYSAPEGKSGKGNC